MGIAQGAVETPLCIDSSNPRTIAEVFGSAKKPGIINSVSLEGDKIDIIFPLIAGTEWSCIALLCDNDGIPRTKGMEMVGDLFSKNEYFLGELMLSAELFKNCQELMGSGGDTSEAVYGKFILGTVYGDVHDIGKNIVSTVLSCNGFEVIDLGVDVKSETFIAAIKEHNDAKIVGLSCLLTTH
jgi:cobalamin-dependent methionine synthase I